MLYNQPAFQETELSRLHEHIAIAGFATLVTIGEDGPLASHLPLLLDREGGRFGVLTGHMARANPQWRISNLGKPALAIFQGPDAYVSPSWYPSKQEHGKVVPTWNFSVVHVRGQLEVFEDPAEISEHLAKLSDHHEARFERPWKTTDAPQDFLQKMIRGITGVRLTIDAIEGKAKLSQSRPEPDRLGVIAGLRASGRPNDLAIAQLMAQRA